MKRAEDPEATPETLAKLQEITRRFDICQRFAKVSSRFGVSSPPENIVFNSTVFIDLMRLEKTSLLHIVDRDTLFSAVIAMSHGETAEDIRDSYTLYWVNVYVGHSEFIHFD